MARDVLDRDVLGRVVREAWVRWAMTQPDPKSSWLVPYDDLSEADKEADRQIAESVLEHLNTRRLELAEKKSREELSEAEAREFAALSQGYFDALAVIHPRPQTDLDRLDAIEKRLAGGE